MNRNLLAAFLMLICLWIGLTNAMKNPNNPPTGKTGAPGENTCAQSDCHSGGTFTGTVTISGVPDTVVANNTYSITLKNTSNAIRAGFQLTCFDNANAMCGTLTAGTGVNIGNGASGKRYARQSAPKTLSNGSASWTFNWTAPASASGNKATFYFVSLCADNSGGKTGDNVLISSKPVVFLSTSATESLEKEAAVSFFPTLVQNNMIQINLLESEHGRLWIYDNNGKLISDQLLGKENTLNLNTLPQGLYSAVIETSGKRAAKKFLVQ
jgi:hypothetical protein